MQGSALEIRKREEASGSWRLFQGADDYAAGGKERMKPTTGFTRLGGNQDDLVSPLSDASERIINAVGVGETVAFGEHVTLSSGLEKIDSAPKAGFIESKLCNANGPSSLAKAIVIVDDDRFSGDAKHLANDSVRLGNMMEKRKGTDYVKAGVGEGECITTAPEDGARGDPVFLNRLLDERGDRLNPANGKARDSVEQMANATAGARADIEDRLRLNGAKHGPNEFENAGIVVALMGVHRVVASGGVRVVLPLDLNSFPRIQGHSFS
jgi:hypothetical protein